MIQRENDGVRWELQPDFAPLLESLLHSPGQTIKASPVKRVTRHEVSGKIFYVKRYLHHAVALRPLKYFFKPTQAREEWRLAHELEARQIPIVRHVALGERRSWRGIEESILVTEGFAGVEAADVTDLDSAVVLDFVNRMHDRGVVQDDLHLANLLVKRSPFELRLVDLHGTRVCDPLTADERERNLAVLRVHLPIAVSSAVEARSRELRKQLLHERSRRCLRNNRDFARQRHSALKWQVRIACLSGNDTIGSGLESASEPVGQASSLSRMSEQKPHPPEPPQNEECSGDSPGSRRARDRQDACPTASFRLGDAIRRLLAAPDDFLASRATPLKDGQSSTVGRADGLVLKRYNFRKVGNLLKDFFRASKARRGFRKAYHLELTGIPTARPIATADRRVLGVLTRSYLLMEEIPDAVDLTKYFRGGGQADAALVRRAAELIARLHAEGFAHRDLKESNLVLGTGGKLFLIDLDGLSFCGNIPESRAAADLERLARGAAKHPAVTRRERRLFYRTYLRTRRLRRLPRSV